MNAEEALLVALELLRYTYTYATNNAIEDDWCEFCGFSPGNHFVHCPIRRIELFLAGMEAKEIEDGYKNSIQLQP